ncbi:MAG: phosphoglycerate dehydrogenase [Atopobiaceae bacterium]|nr:phosphoglycerate dehydrogenase [Atopobiaceae bacterium]
MKVFITPRGFATYGLDQIERMRAAGLEVDYNNTGKSYTKEQFMEKAKDAEGIILGVDDMSAPVLEQLPKLRVIARYGVGVDNIDLDYCKEHGIHVGRSIGSNSLSVAEHALAMMFCDAKNLYTTIRGIKAGGWDKPTGFELTGKTVGIVGFGAIGRHLARLCRGIGMNVMVYDVVEIPEDLVVEQGLTVATLDEIIEQADFISIHVPLLDSTRDLIAAPEMKRMKKNVCIVNAARGGIVNEKDLYEALVSGEVRSAVFDTFSSEPPAPGEPLLELDNFLLTSHTGSRTVEADINTCRITTDIIMEHIGL